MQVFHTLAGAPAPVGPYSVAVKAGGLLFCSGQIGLSPDSGKLVEGGIETEINQVLENLSHVLKGAGASSKNVVMTTIFLTDMADWPVVNRCYGNWVTGDSYPARQTIAVRALPLGAKVEISVVAEVA